MFIGIGPQCYGIEYGTMAWTYRNQTHVYTCVEQPRKEPTIFHTPSSQSNIPMFRGPLRVPKMQIHNRFRLWNSVKWWNTATAHKLIKYKEQPRLGPFLTPVWTSVEEDNLTDKGKVEAGEDYNLHWLQLRFQRRATTSCAVCGEGTVLPYTACRGCICMPSWRHGTCCLGGPTCRLSKTPIVERGYEHVTGALHRPLEKIQGYSTIETPAGPVNPIEEHETNFVVKYGSDDMVRLAMAPELKTLLNIFNVTMWTRSNRK